MTTKGQLNNNVSAKVFVGLFFTVLIAVISFMGNVVRGNDIENKKEHTVIREKISKESLAIREHASKENDKIREEVNSRLSRIEEKVVHQTIQTARILTLLNNWEPLRNDAQ